MGPVAAKVRKTQKEAMAIPMGTNMDRVLAGIMAAQVALGQALDEILAALKEESK